MTVPLLDLEEFDWDRILDTNLKGAFLVGQASGAADATGTAAPSSTWLRSWASGLPASLRPTLPQRRASCSSPGRWHSNGRATASASTRYVPGYIETDLNRAFFQSEAGQAMIRRIPQRRLGRPEDLDGALLLLAGPPAAS